ncbi:DNA cytosine methyltransferase [Rhizobium leguminosarum]|uniref:DNA cytosine methyltransferase n=1 Tax=Rhizobium TaxID=379 RepID=UPI001441B617|nr:DNA cytosine methyltransferase [Rhizobium leguminosarum]MCA2434867.1 DNA cytosine methyltransferase [Rhizobium leguminosarum]NKK09784.1 hypothetical protein [Rhizobium leguminosarum bv. viciae]
MPRNPKEKNNPPLQEAIDLPVTPDEKMAQAHKRISRIRDALTLNLFNIVSEIAESKDGIPLEAQLLLEDCGFAPDEAATYIRLMHLSKDQKAFVDKNDLSIRILMAIFDLDQSAHKAAFMDLETDAATDATAISRIATRLEKGRRSAAARLSQMSARTFDEAFLAIRQEKEAQLRSTAAGLYRVMVKYTRLRGYIGRSTEKFRRLSSSDRYSFFFDKVRGLKREIIEQSQLMLHLVEATFQNSSQPMAKWAWLSIREPGRAYLAQAHFSLVEMSRGAFDRWLPGEVSEHYRWSSLEAVGFLADIPHSEHTVPASSIHPKLIKTLNAFDLCAGAGTHALGVEAAGYYMHGLVDTDAKAIATLRLNRSRWNVIERDLSEPVTEADAAFWLSKHKRAANLDLLCGGLPIKPWAYRENGATQLFTSAVECIRLMKPKAFFFETDVGFKAERHHKFRIELIQELKRLGYQTRIWKLNAANFGIPQDRTRVYLVGVKESYAHGLFPPRLALGASPAASVLNVAFPDLSKAGRHYAKRMCNLASELPATTLRRLQATRTEDQRAYDNWALAWIKEYGGELAPDIAKYRTKPRGRYPTVWRKAGFDPKRPQLPRTGDASLEQFKNGQFDLKKLPRLPLTLPILRALQGIPQDWRFEGDHASQIEQVCSSRPPVIALAIARQIHSAISGQSVDLKDSASRVITSGRERYIPTLAVGPSNHPDPLAYHATQWANEISEREAMERYDDDSGDDEDD